ncbi:hypothetical protein KR093_009366 [Drosophila rubida]|uniref:N-acetylgalactosaminide beta-1,3-galactosyltransferase n=1 Tax=Drosophila rubida TaxID=30044 RepID=A0AAD4PS25_9MUSC|nr:hypothetical protein KR093_009366 [Drosophila rubida]
MSVHRITWEEEATAAKGRDELHVFFGGARPGALRLSRRRLQLTVLLCGMALIALYAYWDVMMLNALGVRRDHNYQEQAQPQAPHAAQLEREVRVLCWVLTTPKYHKSRGVHVLRTWGKHCNKIYFMSSQPDDELETIILTKPDHYEVLWGKTKEAFSYIYEHKRHEADWFLKADDDTYVFMENMRHMLYPYSPDEPIYFGYNYKIPGSTQKNATYMSGGSGYVLSREALRLFVLGLNDSSKCRSQDDSAEDVEAGNCLFHMGVPGGDSRDATLRNRFFPMMPYTALMSKYNGLDFWLFKYSLYNPRACLDCLSEYPVAFHYVAPGDLYVFDFLSYKFDLHGRQPAVEQLPPRIPLGQVVIPPSDN